MADENENLPTDKLVKELVDGLSSSSRRRRQDVSHRLAAFAATDPELVAPHIDALIDALYRPEAQTRWEILGALATLADAGHADEVFEAFDGAEASLFDDVSATVRLAAFLFLCKVGATSPDRSEEAWPLIDEAIQCFHGDAEYHDMLQGLLGFARGSIADPVAAALAARVEFDSKSGNGFIKSFSQEIESALSAR